MKKYYCDTCGDENDGLRLWSLRIQRRLFSIGIGDRYYEICGGCKDRFQEYMRVLRDQLNRTPGTSNGADRSRDASPEAKQ